MPPPENLEPRVAALEMRVQELTERVHASEHDAAAARVLAGAADRDVSEFSGELRNFRQAFRGELAELRQDFHGERAELRQEFHGFRQATTASFNALRADFTDLRRHVDNRFSQVDNGFIDIRGRLDATAAGQQRIVELLERITPGDTGT